MGQRDAVLTDAHSPLLYGGGTPAKGPLQRPVLLDVNPSTLAIQTVGGFTDMLLEKNAPIPIERTRVFTTARDNQTRVEIDCCRGESRRYADNEPLGKLVLEALPAKPRGELKIEVSFRVDPDGILRVRAADADSGQPPGSHPARDRRTRRVHCERSLNPGRAAREGRARDVVRTGWT